MKNSLFATKSISACLIFSLMAISQIFAGNVYHVSNATGDDSNPGTESLPWKTVQKAASTAVAGDMVIVGAGNYDERVSVTSSGTSSSLIQYIADNAVNLQGFNISGNYIQVKGFNCDPIGGGGNYSVNSTGIYITGDYCIIQNNYIEDAPYYGILLEKTADNCTVEYNHCVRVAMAGMLIQGKNHTIVGNEIEDTRCVVEDCTYGDANGFSVFGTGHIFKKNYIHDITFANNPGQAPHIDGFQTWQGSDVTTAENCIFEQNRIELPVSLSGWEHGTGWMFEGAKNITIKNNIAQACRCVHVGDGSNYNIMNNTFIGSLSFPDNHNPAGIWLSRISNSLIKNNIICEQSWMAIYLQNCSNLDIDYHCTYNSNGSIPGGDIKSNDLWGINPNFVSLARGNYHLSSDSLCIETGVTLSSVKTDYDGVSRPQFQRYDIGAYEYKGEDGEKPSSMPVASFTAYPTQGIPPLEVSFDGSASYDLDGNITTYVWDFGDGETGSGMTVKHTYQNRGTYTAKLTVTDNDDQSTSSSIEIKVGTPPVALFEAFPTSGNSPLLVEFDASYSNDTDGKIISYSWNFGDGANGTGEKTTHTYYGYGEYTATLRITDDDGLFDSTSREIKVMEMPYPPLNIRVKRVSNRRKSSSCYCRVEWRSNPKNDERHRIVKYRVYRKLRGDSYSAYTLIKEVSSDTFRYTDRSIENIKELYLYTYTVSAVDDKNRESELGQTTSTLQFGISKAQIEHLR